MKLIDAQTEYVRAVLSAHNVARIEAWPLPRLWSAFNALILDDVVPFEVWMQRMNIQLDAETEQSVTGQAAAGLAEETPPGPPLASIPVPPDDDEAIRRHNEAEIMKLQMLAGKNTPLTVKIEREPAKAAVVK